MPAIMNEIVCFYNHLGIKIIHKILDFLISVLQGSYKSFMSQF